ncbi:Crp/Fnr family transcriptional regulator [Kroppenstedtia pulmonis]|uniref:Crp/Fnr family transcriptional regulator n=1 Tax=Kroppenstedtia pulmonis TaxID=1380685 RepID=A0A7D3Y3T5_9BACL|nr:Crp/Fnr family transcriptional regulator [Kroppenstedtia pulmonis]QKG83685.1 Crp/Fnr family transcriptional regulator [Kroppenstedtia pulmonis]
MILNRGEFLFRQGEEGDLYRVEEGLIKIVHLQSDGTSILFNLIVPGEIIPHHSLLSPKPYFASALAVLPSQVERISADQWYRELKENPVRYKDVAYQLQHTLRLIQQRMEFTTAPVSRRIGLLRNWLSTYFPDEPVEKLLTQEEIGQLIGISRETVNRMLRIEKKHHHGITE